MIVKKIKSPIVCDVGGCKNKADLTFSFFGDKVDMRLCSHCANLLRLSLGKLGKESKKDE
ncbi:MAG: hypothetical protein IJ800_05125 [Clostridia bacterium]|nr:hypothetical protein [Clostridia bacterium]